MLIPRAGSSPRPVLDGGQAIDRVTGTPAIIQNSVGQAGNHEMVVAEGVRLVHGWRNNDATAGPWQRTHAYDFGGHAGDHETRAVARSRVSVGMLRSSFKGDGTHGNVNAVVRLRSIASDDDALMFVERQYCERTKATRCH
jgi:hypothetical protein